MHKRISSFSFDGRSIKSCACINNDTFNDLFDLSDSWSKQKKMSGQLVEQ